MTQNSGSDDQIFIIQTPEAQEETWIMAQSLDQTPMLGAVVDEFDHVIAVLAWFISPSERTLFAQVDDGRIIANPDWTDRLAVKIQDPDTGQIRTYVVADILEAFQVLGVTANRCNGISGWKELGRLLDDQ